MPNLGAWAAAGVAAAVVSVMAAWLAARYSPTPPARLQWWVLVALVCGGIGGHLVLGWWPRWPPTGALDRLLTVILPGSLLVELFIARSAPSRLRELGIRALAGGCWIRILLHGSVYLQPATLASSVGVWSAIVLTGILLGWTQWNSLRLAQRTHAGSSLLMLAACLLTVGLMIVLAGYLKGGAVALIWSAAVLGTSGSLFAGRRTMSLPAVVGVVTTLLSGFALLGCLFGAVRPWASVAVILVPVIGWLAELPGCRSWSTTARESFRWTLILVTLAGLLVLAKLRFDRELRPLLSGGHPAVLRCESPCEVWCGLGRA